jgi:hypothetical protein
MVVSTLDRDSPVVLGSERIPREELMDVVDQHRCLCACAFSSYVSVCRASKEVLAVELQGESNSEPRNILKSYHKKN